jgi:hypothetical protein
VFSGICGGSSLACVNSKGTGGTETINFITYLIMSPTVFAFAMRVRSGSGNFTICVHEPILERAGNPNSPEPINTMVNCTDIPKMGQVNCFCGTTSGYHDSLGSTNRTPYIASFWAQSTLLSMDVLNIRHFADSRQV